MKFNDNKASSNLEQVINQNLNKRLSNYSNGKNNNKKLRTFNNDFHSNSTNDANVFCAQNRKQSIYEERNNLPISSVRTQLINAIKSNDSVIIIGETGCGKTTQIAQYLYSANFVPKTDNNYVIGVTQPRRVAAISIAIRVSQEMNCDLGTIVGYSVRFDNKTSAQTKIKYMTDGILLREAISDPLLRKYKVIIIDESHERTIQTDVLFSVIKKIQAMRYEKHMTILKVIVMSATMDVDHFSKYFNNSPVYYIIGRQFPIDMMYVCKKQSDLFDSALITVFQIHQNEEEGDILVFCSGQEEIENMITAVNQTINQLPKDKQNLKAFPLYSQLPSSIQMNAFKKLSPPNRKVIFATNIAETSITIPNIKYVIDNGKVKSKLYNPITGFEMLKVQPISKAQAYQRSGRAGREFSGKCYRLYTKEDYDSLRDHTIPEIQRCNLANVLMHLIAIGVNDVLKFDFMDPPSEHCIQNALNHLCDLGAVLVNNGLYNLTDLGKLMITFPVEPKYSKIIVTSKSLRCTEEIITILALLSVENIYYIPLSRKENAVEVHKKFISSEGDLIKLLKIYRSYKAAKESVQWCKENYIHISNMKLVNEIRKQLSELCVGLNIPITSSRNDSEILRKCLTSGLSSNVAILQRDGNYKTIKTNQEVFIHPSSCVFGCKPEYVIFNELVQTTKCYMRNICVIDKEWISK